MTREDAEECGNKIQVNEEQRMGRWTRVGKRAETEVEEGKMVNPICGCERRKEGQVDYVHLLNDLKRFNSIKNKKNANP